MANSKKYTYVDFANEAIAIANRISDLFDTDSERSRFIEKAQALIATQTAKSEYNKSNPKKSTAKGASEQTKANGATIMQVLTSEPMTAAEIAAATGVEFTALQVANAVKFLEGVESVKVVRETVNGKGLKAQKEYTAYTLG